MKGVARLRSQHGTGSVDLRIVSAGFGLVREDEALPPYNATFAGLAKGRAQELGRRLHLGERVQEALGGTYDLALFLLGESYLQAIAPHALEDPKRPVVTLVAASARDDLPYWLKRGAIEIGVSETKSFGAGLVALKGKLFSLLAERLATADADAARSAVLDLGTDPSHFWPLLEPFRRPVQQPLPGLVVLRPSHPVATVPSISPPLPARNTDIPFRYFIPDWDDRVDPDYDFVRDRRSDQRADAYAHDQYAHEIYPAPNYDGVLVSRMVLLGAAARMQEQRRRRVLDAGGIKRYLRLPAGVPVMGDCGAFGYKSLPEPPLTSEDVLTYYRELGFDYGVSVDHLVFAGRDLAEQEVRYRITRENARTFLQLVAERGMPASFKPVGAAQGWASRPESYAEAARALVQMGYRYIALGGLVRARTDELLRVLDAVAPAVPDGVGLHLFGIARPDSIDHFRGYGVTSLDSASPLRRAWMDGRKNYFTPSDAYLAIRVPFAKPGDTSALRAQERACLAALREYDAGGVAGSASMYAAIAATLGYQEAHAAMHNSRLLSRPLREQEYARLLHDRPWRSCGCVICGALGIEVALLRGNDRNRRRGFHNTYVFYRRLRGTVAGAFTGFHEEEREANWIPELIGSGA